MLLVAMLLLSGGVLADRLGRTRVFLAGATVFTLASVLCAAAPSPGWLIAGRALQGSGAAALSPASPALLAAAHPVPQDRVKAIGLWAGLSGIGLAAGPVAGGVLVDAFGRPAIFLVNVPIGAVLLVAALYVLTESRDPAAPAIDLPCAALSVLGVGALSFGLIEGGSRGRTSPVTLAAFAAVEQRAPAPILPPRLFRRRLFTVSSTAMAVVGFALTMSPLAGAAVQSVGTHESGLASGVISTTRQIGAVLGVAVLGAVVRTRQSGGASFEAALSSAFVAAGAVTLAGAVVTGLWLWTRRGAGAASCPTPPHVPRR
ncbi:MFS transporter [Streptomyces uncialis]|uniref:MFS transporter n=1 Tax=Streptomyces uncialis TaxID=1048205 RepID=UPI003657BA18